jgi:hypothetical protein
MTTSRTVPLTPSPQIIDINNGRKKFNVEFSIESETDYLVAIVDESQLDDPSTIKYAYFDGNSKGSLKKNNSEPKNYYLLIKEGKSSSAILDPQVAITITEDEDDSRKSWMMALFILIILIVLALIIKGIMAGAAQPVEPAFVAMMREGTL